MLDTVINATNNLQHKRFVDNNILELHQFYEKKLMTVL